MMSSWAPIVLAVSVMAKNGSLVGTIAGLTGLPACSARLTTAVKSWRSWSVIIGFKSPEPGGSTDAVITTTSVVSGSVSARHRSSIPRLYGDRIATSLRYGFVRFRLWTLSWSACFSLNCSRCS